ncbi:hypothetical protein CCHL11_01722 [Colletotrichum chlorophyti]|uniref:Acriflavine sensitivity control protein acr-2 n=1 Tax=Colletotrichum chlorophyti TaxID=708187 RepID=A0A1Q8RVI1_9PEZI|nr:hypothetical protein CCHL11_01722 [Colletotrichum chlorophyti]
MAQPKYTANDSNTVSGYYDNPVPIWIPRSMEPLPDKLRENPMNLLMAERNDHLLSLLLAYSDPSAAHRAKFLGQREPQTRIALWVQDIFPALRQALSDREQIISNTSLATAIMLASLEIISPTAFGYDIPWQRHLNLARDLMCKRLADLRRRGGLEEDRICTFLWSWFAYLDVLGTLSGGTPDDGAARTWLLEYVTHTAAEDRDEIDCIMGFTARCMQLLAQIADLARRCDKERIKAGNWTPGSPSIQQAVELEEMVLESVSREVRPCRHIRSVGGQERREMGLMNEAFHWAGTIHLHRRVLRKPSDHADVQRAVGKIVDCMESIRKGGTAETGFLFPMFTAGCNSLDERQRARILERFRSVESNGMAQVYKARRLMEDVWVTGSPWQPLLCSEFIG